MLHSLKGIAASAGVAIAKAFVHEEPDFYNQTKRGQKPQ